MGRSPQFPACAQSIAAAPAADQTSQGRPGNGAALAG